MDTHKHNKSIMQGGSKGQIGGGLTMLSSAAIALVILIVVLMVGALVTAELNEEASNDYTNNDTAAANITESGLAAFDEFGDWLDIIVIVIIAVVIIALVMWGFKGIS